MPEKKPIDWEKATKTKVTVPIAVLVGFLFVGMQINSWTVSYLSEFFLTTAAAEDISKAVAQNARNISAHISEYKINEATKAITNIQDALFDLSQWVVANSETAQTRQRRHELEGRLTAWNSYRDCLVTGGPNCGNIRP